ncbi:Oidioi.mRNA.OKI2018_I69.PAR.g10401.t1.cds [Oikopleura dioica]|uniref:Oidioi.mRNA.OKI2018_I69.PAR.g10401.t1.cds n=1 Tax=Oikopleura dioica TaxID=34765 RepID=A0ABN7RVM1_OIKDI|nr:Oidioi.mRNA.OKI2018_I69.PAR.g10401.t1.cds [Oikopleura dioica]
MLESERNDLQKSMITLTSRLAQVEFRLSQALNNPEADRDCILKDLSDFVSSSTSSLPLNSTNDSGEDSLTKLSIALKDQLDEVERLAAGKGLNNHITKDIIQGQQESLRILSEKLGLKGEIATTEQAKQAADEAMKNLLMPQIEKEQLVDQLQTKVKDLERFIEFMQQNKEEKDLDLPDPARQKANSGIITKGVHALIKIGTLLPYLLVKNLTCGKAKIASKYHDPPDTPEEDQDTVMTSAPKPLDPKEIKPKEIEDLIHTVNLVKLAYQRHNIAKGKRSRGSECEHIATMDRLVSVVRKQLSNSIAAIFAHHFDFGSSYLSSALSTITYPVYGCFRDKDSNSHAEDDSWQILLKFFEVRGGNIMTKAPNSALRHAFGMKDPLLGRNEHERSLLETIHNVKTSHEKFKAYNSSMFRAVICHGLNERCLTAWLYCVFKALNEEYQPDAFLRQHGYDQFLSVLLPLEKLQNGFDLPANLAIKNLNDIKDAY